MASMSSDEVVWEPPGPGQWYYVVEHLPGAVSMPLDELRRLLLTD